MTNKTLSESETDSDRQFMEIRTQNLLNTPAIHRGWGRESSHKLRTWYHVVVPEDGENYWEPMTIMKLSNSYVLAQHNTGIIPGHSKLSSRDYEPLKELGDRLFSQTFI